MDRELLKLTLDSCFMAKRITEKMAPLPDKMKPRHIHVVDAIYEILQHHEICRVSDVSSYLGITTPSVTKLISELEKIDLVRKIPYPEDKRVTLVELTEKGNAYEQNYVIDYHSRWAESIDNITEEQALTTIYVIKQLLNTIPEES